MNNMYDLQSWSKEYREEALQAARTRSLGRQARTPSGSRFGSSRASVALKNTLRPVLSGAWLAR
ncbi:MAG: hypothetical protein M3151_11610 [Actinomycetota bacterium]|nr:hypothetical protein [Actinomycetota bacterium]